MATTAVKSKETRDVVIIELPEVLDYPTVNKIRDIMNKSIDMGKPKIILDFTKVKEINSTGIGIIISRVRRAREKGGDIKILKPKTEVRKIIEVMGADKIFDIVNNIEEGLSLFEMKID
ncbi:MAG: STAS domain-containing protein [Candidatus Hydrogenedentota bacterium]